jgi:hypothetical protein
LWVLFLLAQSAAEMNQETATGEWVEDLAMELLVTMEACSPLG